jgi:hypothetical protein
MGKKHETFPDILQIRMGSKFRKLSLKLERNFDHVGGKHPHDDPSKPESKFEVPNVDLAYCVCLTAKGGGATL